jgi:aspartyl/asparaginyl beta-hydroxylase (cupin superfamily)
MMKNPTLVALEQQLSCYQRLAKLAQIQHEHVQHSRTEDLLSVLGQRQQVLDEVADLEQSISPAKKRWSEFLLELTDEDREEAERMMAATRTLLEAITTADRNDAMALQQRKLNLGREINHATNARQINKKYAAAAYGNRPAALDLQR